MLPIKGILREKKQKHSNKNSAHIFSNKQIKEINLLSFYLFLFKVNSVLKEKQ